MEDYAPDPYDEGASQNFPIDTEGVGASSAPPDVLASQAPSRTYGRPPRGVAPPCGWAAGNAETDPSYLNMAMGYNDPGDLVFDPGTGSWVKVSKHKHKKKKGGQSLPTMLPGMPPMGFGMYGNPMMGAMGMPMMPASMPAAFPGMYPGMTPPVASGSGFAGKSSKKDIKHEARKEVKKMLKKEKEEEERQAEKEARRRRKELERKWEEDEERERERQRKLRKEQERRMEEEARARAIQDAREREARQAAERDAMEQARLEEERESQALADLRQEQQRRAAHEKRTREQQLSRQQEERRAEERSEQRSEQIRRQEALAGVEEAARIGARSPASTRNPWLSDSKDLTSTRSRQDDYDDDDEYDEYDEEVKCLDDNAYGKGRRHRSPLSASPQTYTSSSSRPPPYRSHPSSRANSGASHQDQGPARDWLDDIYADDTRSIRSASSSSSQARRQIQQPKYHQTYPRHGHHLHADHHQQHRPRATSSASLSDVRAMRGNSDARPVSSACSSRSNDIRAGSENGQRGTQQGSQSDKPTYERAGSSYTYGSGSLQSSLTESAYTRSGDFIRERSHSQSYHARPPENDLHQHHSRYQKEYPASHTGFIVEHEHHEQPHHAHHNDHHRIQFSAHPKKKVDETGEWDFDTSPGHHEKGRSLSHNPVKAISSSMDRLRIPGSSEIRRSAPVLKKKESHLEGDEDDDEEAIYSRREVRSCSAASGSVASSFFRAGRLGSLDRDDRASVRSGRSAFSYVSDDARCTGSARSASSHSSNQRQR